MADIPVAPSVAITKMIVDFLPVLIPLVAIQSLQFVLSLRSAARAEATAVAAKDLAQTTAKAVDGQMSEFKAKLEETSDLKAEIARLTALALGKEEGAAKAKLETLQHDQLTMARALPPSDPKIVNGGTEPKIDSIKETGEDTNKDVKKVKTVLGDRVDKVEEKLDGKEDKA